LRFKNLNIHEFIEICVNDAYHLATLKRKIKSIKLIVDVGANQGLFLVAARQHFHKAHIICYEPNRNLEDSLEYNAKQLNAEVHYEAVVMSDCLVGLNLNESDLATTVFQSETGTIPGVSLKKIIQRTGIIDVLKLDCEGSEWELLEDTSSWKNIKSVTLEYHLWARPGMTTELLFQLLHNVNFKIIEIEILTPEQGIVLAINNHF
jgi:FkbM family methyltransferase